MPRKGGSGGGGGRSYVDNASNRSLGRVGMSVGSAPVSRTSGSSSSNSYSSNARVSQSTYVDNSTNRNLGRVGMERGSAPVSRSSSSNPSYSSQSTYVDNAMNRDLGRVGMERGSAPVSRSSSSYPSYSSQSTYVDNVMNRDLGRVGMERGSAPVSRSSSSNPSYSSQSAYVDNSVNRSLGRVGMERGSAPVSRTSRSTDSTPRKPQKCYVDNAFNRRHGRVGMALGTASISRNSRTKDIQKAYRDYEQDPMEFTQEDYRYQPDYQEEQQHHLDPSTMQTLQEMLRRMEIWEQQKGIKGEEYTKQSLRPTSRRGENYNKVPLESYGGAVIQFENLKLGEKIGHGGFGDVFKGEWLGKVVAIKKLRVQRVSSKRRAQFEEEIKVFAALNHKNIITFYGACVKTPNLCMVMEFMSGSLYDKIFFEECQFTSANKVLMTKEIACGLEYLHSQDVAHCDVKLSNILIDVFNQDTLYVKLTDFGLSLMKNDAESSTSKSVSEIGTPRYSAPEILRGEQLNRMAMKMTDVYSFGLVVYEIFSEEEVFDGLNTHQLRKQIGDGDVTPPLEQLHHEVDNKLISLMKKCWSRNATNRPSMDMVSLILMEL